MKNGLYIDKYKTKRWYKDDILHREDGPAFENSAAKIWIQHGASHRLDGPASEWYNGNKYWYLNGIQIDCKTNEEFLRLVKLMSFI